MKKIKKVTKEENSIDILLRAQDNRIERLEDNMRLVKTALEMA
jgi:hypothetical protein